MPLRPYRSMLLPLGVFALLGSGDMRGAVGAPGMSARNAVWKTVRIGPVAPRGFEGSPPLYFNNRGQVAGSTLVQLGRRVGRHYRAFLWDPNERRPRPRYLGRNDRLGYDTWATGISSAEPPVMRGASLTSNLKAFAWNGGPGSALPWSGMPYWRERIVRSLQISHTGWFLGQVDDGEYENPKIIRWNPTTAAVEQLPNGGRRVTPSAAWSINDSGDALVVREGQVLFWGRDGAEIEIREAGSLGSLTHLSSNAAGTVALGIRGKSPFDELSAVQYRCFLWSREGGLREVLFPGHPDVTPRKLTPRGELLVRVGATPEASREHLWRDENGNGQSEPEEFTDLTPAGAVASTVLDMNDAEPPQVLLTAGPASGARTTYLWRGGAAVPVSVRFPPRAQESRVFALNDRGQLLGIARIGRAWHGYLVSPASSNSGG